MSVSTVFAVFATASAFSTAAMANPIEAFGSAPASLDYPKNVLASDPAGFSRNRSAIERRSEINREELFFLSASNPFPTTAIPAIDPITKEKKDRVLIGPAFRVRGHGSGFDYYRYVSFYDVFKRRERIYELPEHQEECHDNSAIFASYNYNFTYSASVTASASLEGLGLSATITASRAFSTGRQLLGIGGIEAVHTPYFVKQDWEGRTFIQTYNSKTRKTAFLTEQREGSSWFVQTFLPILAETEYPMEFEIKDADWSFQVQRTILRHCDLGFGE